MNRKRCVFCLVLFIVLFSPALAKGEPSPPAPEALFQALEEAVALQAEELKIPEPFFAHHCNAQQTCPSQCVVSCTGHTSCTVQATSVRCDGVTTNCPYPGCNPPASCDGAGCKWCECVANGGTPAACYVWCL